MKLKEKLKNVGKKVKAFLAKNWKPLVLGTVTVGGVIYAIVCKKKIKKLMPQKIDVEEWNVGEIVGCYDYDQFTEVATNHVPIKELGALGEEALKKIPGVTEDTLVCVDANFLKWRPEGK